MKYRWGISERKNRTMMAKDNYSNKAIKMNPEYKLYEKEAFEKEYSPEIVAAAETLKGGEYRVSAKQTRAIKEAVKKGLGKQKLKGPLLSNYALGHEAVLLKIGSKKPFGGMRWAKLIELTTEGDYAERKFEVDCAYVRNIPGNHVMVVRGNERIGIYENVFKNKENPVMLNYENFMKKALFSRMGCYIQQVLLFVISFVLVIAVWMATQSWLIFPEVAFCLVAARAYKHLVSLLSLKYIARYGITIYENMFHKWWKVLYFILNVLAIILVCIK